MASPKSFVEWVFETYRDQLRLGGLEGSRAYRKFLETLSIRTFPLSGAVRVQSFHIVKFGYPMMRAGYVTAAFTVRVAESTTRQHEAYYAYAYWPRQAGGAPPPAEPEYICLSPTFESRDGEYRHRFLWYKQFREGYEANAARLARLEEALLAAVGDDEVGFDLLFFPEDGGRQRAAWDAAIAYADRSRLGLRALVALLAVDALRARDGTLPTHASAGYVTVMDLLYAKGAAALSSWTMEDRHQMAVFETGKAGQPLRAQCGQKLMPLTVRESLNVGDINFAPWREAWVGRRATDLVVNGVAPTFPIYNNWAYLEGADQSLFENAAMRRRYDRSRQAEGVADSLRRARALAGEGGAAEADYRMGQLDAHVFESIAYAQDYVLLTGLALCATSEYVGLTFASLPEIARRSKTLSPAYLRAFADPAMVARYLFDLCYGAHALHARAHVVHGDLHANNFTLHELENQYRGAVRGDDVEYTPRYANPLVAYALGGEAQTYVFPHDGWFACLIDFSRAVVGPGARADIAAEFGEPFAASFYRDQVTRVLRVLHFYTPAYVEKHQEQIKGLLYADFGAMFDVLTAVDFLAIGRNFGAVLKAARAAAPGARALEVAAEGVKMAANIEARALEHLIVHLADLVEGRRGAAGLAGAAIIPGVFGDYKYAAWAGGETPAHVGFSLARGTLVDAYNAGAPLTYSGSDYSRFPPWARFADLERHLGGIKIAQVTADRGERPFLESRDLDGYLAVLQEQVRRNAEDRPAAATSSWIME